MRTQKLKDLFCPGIFICLLLFISCGTKKSKEPTIISSPEELRKKSTEFVADLLKEAVAGNGKTSDSLLQLGQPGLTAFLYEKNDANPDLVRQRRMETCKRFPV
ncbi:MAG TPA: hypothetical protein VMZ03_12850 [Chitinophagaceae bacterium]|nr:hypothetical protein [Chitinophagaceae bacterium]